LAAAPDTMDHTNGLEGDGYVIDVADLVIFGSGQIYNKVGKFLKWNNFK
jgi:hypothetical protein